MLMKNIIVMSINAVAKTSCDYAHVKLKLRKRCLAVRNTHILMNYVITKT